MSIDSRISRRSFLAGTAAVGAMGMSEAASADKPASAPERPQGEWEIGCYTRPWSDYEYRVALDGIAEAGFKNVGLMTAKMPGNFVISTQTTPDEAHAVGEEVRKRGLRVGSIYAGGELPVSEGVDAASAVLRKVIDNCVAAGASSLLMGGIGNEKQYDVYYSAIAATCDYAAGKKLEITVKPHGGLNATGAQCRKVIEKVNHRNFRLWYDAGNIMYYSDGRLDPAEEAATVDGLVTGMCVKDYLPPKNVAVQPGEGKVNFKAVLTRLKKGGFVRGPLVVEMLAPAANPAGIVENAKKARLFLESLLRQV